MTSESTTDNQPEKEELSGSGILDHLEDLRWVILKAFFGLIFTVGFSAYYIDFIIDKILLKPLHDADSAVKLLNLKPFGQIVLYMEVAFFSGLILGIPWVLYQVWKFIAPALYKKELTYIKSIVFFSSFCFLSGVAFGYFVVIPYSLGFFLNFGSDMIQNLISAEEYMSFIVQIILGSAVLFELPMVSYFLSRLGLLTPAFMQHYRRYAYIVVIIIAGVITPPDVISQLLLMIPTLLLYEISIFISGRVLKNKERKAAMTT